MGSNLTLQSGGQKKTGPPYDDYKPGFKQALEELEKQGFVKDENGD